MQSLKRLGALAASLGVLVGIAAVAGLAATGNRTQLKSTKSYVFALHVGMPEPMYTPAQVRAKHPKHGEVMLGGAMPMGGGMSMHGLKRHLEVRISERASGKVVSNGHPRIDLRDQSVKGALMTRVPVAKMEGIGKGVSDLHYGNNVSLIGGHRYSVTVALNGEQVVFSITVPAPMQKMK